MAEGPLRTKTQVRRRMEAFLEENPPAREVTFLMHDWEDGYNVGGMLRVADALGVRRIYSCGRTPVDHPTVGVTSMGAHRRIEVREHRRPDEAVEAILADGWTPVALEISGRAAPYTQFDWPARTCLVLGNEGAGLPGGTLKLIGASVFIPMAGKGRSLNVHVSAAVAAFHAVYGDQGRSPGSIE
ncbi:MAG: hypothetical protein MH204_06515 [Fimbriimonadaceae bacterium]|nr:hypothetical protein [Fimbriimonadaceae bacterium]